MPSKRYVPSNSIKKQIASWEGTSMRTNRSFAAEAKDFENWLRRAGIYDLMTLEELDPLFSLSYNIGSSTFNERVVPSLIILYTKNGNVEDVLKNMYGKRDSDPSLPGLRSRRRIEKDSFRNAYTKNHPPVLQEELPIIDLTQPADKTRVVMPRVLHYDFAPKVQSPEPPSEDINMPVRSRPKKGQEGMRVEHIGPYNTNIYLEKDPITLESTEYYNLYARPWYPELDTKARMDLTVQLLSNGLSTYKPTPYLQQQKMIPYHDAAGNILTGAVALPF